MGDRANVYVKEGSKGVYLYTHWSGYRLPHIVQNALKRSRDRWDDDQYLARIIFSEMIKDEVMDTTGYGISASMCDNERSIIVIECESNTIGFAHEGKESEDCYIYWPFDKYITLKKSVIDEKYR